MNRGSCAIAGGDVGDIAEEVERYFNITESSLGLENLRAYPKLLKAFMNYNSSVSSSAAVERLFSCAGQILVPRRCKVSDEMFDKLVFLWYKLKTKKMCQS